MNFKSIMWFIKAISYFVPLQRLNNNNNNNNDKIIIKKNNSLVYHFYLVRGFCFR